MRITPKTKRNISRIIPYSVIWVLCGWVIIISEVGVTRNQNINPDTDIAFTIPVLIFANIANFIVGFIVGSLEVVYLQKRFTDHTLRAKIFYKFLIYLSLFIVVIVGFYPVAFFFESSGQFRMDQMLDKSWRFLSSISFLLTLFQLAVTLLVCLIYSAISENLGHHVFLNLITGRYHTPVVEDRVFMFLDMKSSTSIAEQLGHVRYFDLLKDYYNVMSDPIINTLGEVYQYIGDEIVVSWKLEKGLKNANCIQCFFAIKKALTEKRERFMEEYGVEVDFKAGVHFGEVTIGEIGALKKEIVFTGDVLNTTARIQSQCNDLQSNLLISGALKNKLPQHSYKMESKGEMALKGRNKKEVLYQVLK